MAQAQPGAAVAFSSRASAEDLVIGAQARSRQAVSGETPRVRTTHAAGVSPQDSTYRGSAMHLEGWVSLSRF